jgi:hypothetical protein
MNKNNQFYKILCLQRNNQILIKKRKILINLNTIKDNKIIVNDEEFNSNLSKNNYFFISGGGSFLFQNRYLLLTQRSTKTIINKNKLSLFTGRSDNINEWRKPSLIIRELFEEINILKDNIPVYFINEKFQDCIDNNKKDKIFLKQSKIKIENINISNYNLHINEDNINIFNERGFMHISKKNDINLLYFFNIGLDPLTLKYESIEDDNAPKRPIYFLDLKDRRKIYSLNSGKFIELNKKFEYSEHCLFSIQALSSYIHNDKEIL